MSLGEKLLALSLIALAVSFVTFLITAYCTPDKDQDSDSPREQETES